MKLLIKRRTGAQYKATLECCFSFFVKGREYNIKSQFQLTIIHFVYFSLGTAGADNGQRPIPVLQLFSFVQAEKFAVLSHAIHMWSGAAVQLPILSVQVQACGQPEEPRPSYAHWTGIAGPVQIRTKDSVEHNSTRPSKIIYIYYIR